MSRLRAWWQRFCEHWIAARNPYDYNTDFQESDPGDTVWPESAPDELTRPRPEQVK